MDNTIVDITIGGLLHDIGKLVYRSGDHREHSGSGKELAEEIGTFNENVLDCIAYHHFKRMANASIAQDSPAYITYIADNISSGADRREAASEEGAAGGFDPTVPLASVFNILNNNDEHLSYAADTLEHKRGINFPSRNAKPYDAAYYNGILRGMVGELKHVKCSREYLSSISKIMECYTSYVPSSTSKDEQPDISLFDHSKTTAAIACCIYEYLSENGITDYKQTLFARAEKFYDEKCFLLFSCDMSGIQDFLYTVSGEKMLKSLRARSYYLEIMLEHIIDEILDRVGLPRVNLIYSGGGHAYILMANTEKTVRILDTIERELNVWFLNNFKTALYIASSYYACSGNDLKNRPSGSYSNIYKNDY